MPLEEFEVPTSFTSEPDPTPSEQKKFDEDLYKKWFRSKDQSGFLGIRPWPKAGKVVIDIGKADPNSGSLLSSTVVYVDAIRLATYLRAVVSGYGTTLYPADERNMVPTPEGLTLFGGSKVDGKPVGRVFKSHHFRRGENYDSSAFHWKTGHFEARETSQGAFVPDTRKPISTDMIKVTRQDLAEISYRLDLFLLGYAARNEGWFNVGRD